MDFAAMTMLSSAPTRLTFDAAIAEKWPKWKTKFNLFLTAISKGLGKLPFKCNLTLGKDAVPVVRPARRLPEVLKTKLKAELKRLENLGIIEKIDKPTDWVHDLVIVEKKNGKVRLCINPIPLNRYLKREFFTIPTQEELTVNLSGKKLYTVMDMKEGYHQCELTEEASLLCVFNTCYGRYRYLRMPFGLSVSPEIFQRENYRIFGDLDGVQIFFDDAIISGETEEEHDRNLEAFIKRARENNIKFNKEKMQYKLKEVQYLGFIFSEEGVRPDPTKTKAIVEMKTPASVKDLQRFLGAVNFINKFIPSYSQVTAPLRELMKKNSKWEWTDRQQNAFTKIKKLVTKTPTLKIFNAQHEVVIQCDASQDGIGCCLLQNKQPVAFASRSLTEAEKRYSTIEKEMLGICFSVNRFHHFIYGHPKVTINTDHKPLITIIKKEIYKNSARLQRMQLKLLKYQFQLEYLPGSHMFMADMLSRASLEETNQDVDFSQIVHAVTLEEYLPFPKDEIEKLKTATENDGELSALKSHIHHGWKNLNRKLLSGEMKIYYGLRDELFEQGGIIFYNGKIIIPTASRKLMVGYIHRQAHLGITKTVARIRSIMYWPRMEKDIIDIIERCATCQTYQRKNVKEPMILSKTPYFPFQFIGMDIGEYRGKIFLVIEDYYSRWLDLIPLRGKTANEVIDKLKVVFSTHGTPENVRCDNNPFSSKEFINFAKSWGFTVTTSSPLYSKSNGLSEKGVGIAKNLIKKSIHSGTDFYQALQEYRATPLTRLQYSPSQLLMGRIIRTRVPVSLDILMPKTPPENIRIKMEEEKKKTKENYDKSARQRKDFTVGQPISIYWQDHWKEGTVIEVLPEPRSYLVRDVNGAEYRRNSSHLRERKVEQPSSPCHQPVSPPTRTMGSPREPPSRKPATEPRRLSYSHSPLLDQPGTDPGPQTQANPRVSEARPDSRETPKKSRYGRTIKQPKRLTYAEF
uniref:RNA-directed DNA polymerase n=1 Tax=Lygus hesperus TaxID=30085 RepID=A0A0A9W3X7_LYGHE